MRTKIIAVGKLKEAYLKAACDEYAKRLSKYTHLEIIEVSDEKAPDHLSPADEAIIKTKEGERILKKVDPRSTLFALHPAGPAYTSEKFAKLIENHPRADFVIGGSLGLSDTLLKSAQLISFSDLTFPHQIVRVLLLEQIYRGYRIQKNEPYHK